MANPNPNRKVGDPALPGSGRPAGSQNKITLAARHYATTILEHPEYRKALMARAVSGDLAPQVEVMLWHYAYGVPKQKMEHTHRREDWTTMTTGELEKRAAVLLEELKGHVDLERAEKAMEKERADNEAFEHAVTPSPGVH